MWRLTDFVSDLAGQQLGLIVPGGLKRETGVGVHGDDEEPLVPAGVDQGRHHHGPQHFNSVPEMPVKDPSPLHTVREQQQFVLSQREALQI